MEKQGNENSLYVRCARDQHMRTYRKSPNKSNESTYIKLSLVNINEKNRILMMKIQNKKDKKFHFESQLWVNINEKQVISGWINIKNLPPNYSYELK